MGIIELPENALASSDDAMWMEHALALAERAGDQGEVPVGAVMVKAGQLIGEGYNQPIVSCDPTAHAEIVALRAAGQALQNYRMGDTTLYVTLEPCLMCIGALVHARVQRLVYGANEPKTGAIVSKFTIAAAPDLNHRITCQGGVLAERSSELLSTFFRARRNFVASKLDSGA